MRGTTVILVLFLILPVLAHAGPERRDVDGRFMFVLMQSTTSILNPRQMAWDLCIMGNQYFCEVTHDSDDTTRGDEVCWDGGWGMEAYFAGDYRPHFRILLGGPRIHEDPHYLPLMRQEVVELSNLMRHPVPVVGEGVEDVLDYCPEPSVNLRWIAFDMFQDPEYAWERKCGYASPNYYYYPELNILDLPTFVFGWDSHVAVNDGCRVIGHYRQSIPAWVDFADTLLEEVLGGPPIGGGQDLAMLSELWPTSVYADRVWKNAEVSALDTSTQTGKPRVELEPIDREVHTTYWRMVDWWLARYRAGEVSDAEVVRWASMRAFDYWDAVYFEKNYFGEEFAEVYNSNDGFCPVWTEGDLGREFDIHISRAIVPDPWTPVVNGTPVARAYRARLHCRWWGGDLYCTVEEAYPVENDYSCIAVLFQQLPYPRAHFQRVGLGGWHETLAEGPGQETVYADFDYVGVVNGKMTFRLDRYGVLKPVPSPVPDMLEACVEIGRQICGRLQDCVKLVEPGVVNDPDPLPAYCPQNFYEDPELYEHECHFFVSGYGECVCYGGKCPPGR